jgi:hypothetical protein
MRESAGSPIGNLGSSPSSANGVSVIPGFTGGASAEAYGTGAFPFTTKRSAQWTNNGPFAGVDDPVPEYPWRATGKLSMRFCVKTYNSDIPSPLPCTASDERYATFVCTASLVRPGVLITAAHCIHVYGYGSTGLADLVYWYPAKYGATNPYGVYRMKARYLPTVYFNGTDTCQNGSIGVVCNNDLAVVILWANNDGLTNDSEARAGNIVGWYSYGWNGYSGVTSPYLGNRFAAQITQLGYPVAIDSGQRQIRTDSVGVYSAQSDGVTYGLLEQTTIGSAQTGGSSGGPWLVNFGTPPVHNSGSSQGSAPSQAVVGVTSWGYININIKVQGASHFGQNNQFPNADYGGRGAGNIGALVSTACVNFPSAC